MSFRCGAFELYISTAWKYRNLPDRTFTIVEELTANRIDANPAAALRLV